jgi:hypothetical protein
MDEDIAAVTSVTARARKIRQNEEDNVTTEKSPLVTTEVRSVVVDETRRGNVAAVRRESQRESSLQLQPQRQVEGGGGGGGGDGGDFAEFERHDSSIAKKENPGSELVETAGRRSEALNESQSKKTLEEAAARKANNRSKRKKRR